MAFMGFICFTGYVLMVSEPLRNTFIMYIGIIGFPLALAMIFDGFSCIYLRVLISHDKITIKRFLRKTVTLDKSEVNHFTNLIALDSGRRGDVRLINIFIDDKSYKFKYYRGLVQNESSLLKSLKKLGSGEKHLSTPSMKARFYF